jgi:N-acetylmuramoyl-L-alanine amidase
MFSSKNSNTQRIIYMIIIFCVLFLSTPCFASKEILNVRHWTAPDHTRIVLDINDEPDYQVEENNDIVTITFRNTLHGKQIPAEIILNKPGIKKIVFYKSDAGNLKVEFYLDEHKKTDVFRLKKFLDRPDRVVFDVILQAQSVQEEVLAQPEPLTKRTRIIVIDPGHGGEDPGAISKKGVYEKNIVLSISKEIKKEIDKIPGFRAVLTRSGDYYVSFSKRLQIAKDIDASLFISVHADAAKSRKAKGSSVYSLSTGGASSEAAKLLASNENLSDIIGGVTGVNGKNEFDPIILNMFQINTINLSRNYAEVLIRQLNKITCTKFQSVQEAPFNVLKLPDIPAVLLEAAYLSNPEEEKLLRSRDFQKRLAVAVASSVSEYFGNSTTVYDYITAKSKETKTKTIIKRSTGKYTIKRGDTLASIAKNYDTNIATILKLNNMKLSDKIYGGQKIFVPATGAPISSYKKPTYYTVKKGDTLSSIAKSFNTSVSSLLKLNNFDLHQRIYVGQKIIVSSERTLNLKKYKVKQGDTLFSLAKNSSLTIDELCELNNMNREDKLYLGQILNLPK